MSARPGDLESMSHSTSWLGRDDQADTTATKGASLSYTIDVAVECHPDPGPGSWAFVRAVDGTEWEESGEDSYTTATRMELTAALKALEDTVPGSSITVYAHGQLLQHMMKDPAPDWQRTGWRTHTGHTMEHQDLWKKLWSIAAERTVQWECLGAHGDKAESHNPRSSRASELAATARHHAAVRMQREHAISREVGQDAGPGMDTTYATLETGQEPSMNWNQAPPLLVAEDDPARSAPHYAPTLTCTVPRQVAVYRRIWQSKQHGGVPIALACIVALSYGLGLLQWLGQSLEWIAGDLAAQQAASWLGTAVLPLLMAECAAYALYRIAGPWIVRSSLRHIGVGIAAATLLFEGTVTGWQLLVYHNLPGLQGLAYDGIWILLALFTAIGAAFTQRRRLLGADARAESVHARLHRVTGAVHEAA